MVKHPDGAGEFTEVVLRPRVAVAERGMLSAAAGPHERPHQLCFIARSVNFPVRHELSTSLAAPAPSQSSRPFPETITELEPAGGRPDGRVVTCSRPLRHLAATTAHPQARIRR